VRDEDIARGPTRLAAAEEAGGEGDERLEPGARAGEYEIVRHLGSGAMGDVYAGRHPVIGKQVAVKVIKRKLAASAEAAERFVREARAVNRVDHPNLLDVFAFGRLDDGRPYLVMDLLAGESLGDRLRREGALPAAEALDILTPVCEALAAAHDEGVVHRDLKPDNVFLARGGRGDDRVFVLDFGIAKMLGDATAETAPGTLTGEGVWIGTPAYMSPEQWTAEGATARSDLYAAGAMLYEMLTGKAPYQARSVPAMMEKHFHAEVPPLTTHTGARLPAAWHEVVRRAMAKKPEDRPADARALLDEARAALDGAGRAVTRDGGGVRRMWPVALGGLLAIAAAGVLVALSRGPETEPEARPAAGPVTPAAAGAHVLVSSSPAGARLEVDGVYVSNTPHTIPAEPGEVLRIRVSRPGFGAVERTVEAGQGAPVHLTLPPAAGYEGVWQLASGELRAFERSGERIAGYRLQRADGEREFMRFFDFAEAAEGVRFAAAEETIDERAPNEPSCRFQLRAEYHYLPAGDRLTLRREEVNYDLHEGRCTEMARRWSEPTTARRLDEAAMADAVWAASHAGSGNVAAARDRKTAVPPVQAPDDGAQAGAPARKQPPAKEPPPSKADAVQSKEPPAQQAIPPVQNQAPAPEPAGQQAGADPEAAPGDRQTRD
jgi:tRNA A-37 threonylcarbamoyl transferase component Bud32